MRKKVYCKNCEYFNPRFHKNFNCEIPGNIIDTWKRENVKQLRMFVAAEKNRNNNCPDYKRKWWKFWVEEEQSENLSNKHLEFNTDDIEPHAWIGVGPLYFWGIEVGYSDGNSITWHDNSEKPLDTTEG